MRKLSILGLAAAALYSGASFAHHSPIVFDRTREVTIVGVVTEFKWSSPHAWIHLDVADGKGHVDNWGVEMDPATNLARAGWKSTSVKPGDKVSIVVHPLRNDEKGGQYISVTLPDGTKLGRAPDGVI